MQDLKFTAGIRLNRERFFLKREKIYMNRNKQQEN
jgi:hypothetical protein